MNSDFSIALCCNGSLLPGLHATLASLTRSLGAREKVSLHLFISGIDEEGRAELKGTVDDAGGVGRLQFHEMDLSEFQDLKSLHGDRTTYLRLKLPDLLADAPVILYLDADLIVQTDICEMFALPLGDAPLGGIAGETVSWSLDRDFYLKIGLTDEDDCFNAGVLLLNAARWRELKLGAQALEFGRKHDALLKSHDQTIMNALFARTFYHLPRKFNIILAPETRRVEAADGIYHFMGSPKPWDPCGTFFHRNCRMWNRAIRGTHFKWAHFLGRHGKSYATRTWSLRFSYLRVLKRRLEEVLKKN